MKQQDILIFIPTYNERENVEPLFRAIDRLGLQADVLFMDDNSPDGTGEIIDEMAKKHPGLSALHREGKLGIGSAHQEGIKCAYEKGYKILITMDCDFTHPPEYIPLLLKNSADCDIVVTSRYMARSSLAGWNPVRRMLTHLGHLFTTIFLRMPYDATGAFRLYKLDRIPSCVFDLVSSKGYSFFYESLYILNVNKFKIGEIPIKLSPRTYGHSKMKTRDVWTSFKFLVGIYLNSLINRERYTAVEHFTVSGDTLPDTQDWNNYWHSRESSNRLLYDAIAAFYRKYIIKRNLNYFVKRYFARGANILHAGCGGGQVDSDIREYVSLTALDISTSALSIYKSLHRDSCKIVYGTILKLPFGDGKIDGIYNLGVMEHFTEKEIDRILGEFRRVLVPDGRLIIFWPPEYRVSVIFFKILRFIFKNIFGRKNVKFHPDEITRVKSRKHAFSVFTRNGFRIIRYSFSLRDLFTYVIIVAERKTG